MDKEIKTKATSSDIAKPFSPKEVSYNDGNLYQLVGIAIPVPDGMRYMARTLNESVPDGMVFQPEDNRYNFICYSGKKLKDISYYKDSRFGVSVNVPWSFDLYAQVGALQDSDISSQTVERVLAYLAKQIGNSKIFDICIDKDEDNFVIAHGTLGRSTDKDEYWEEFLFVVINGIEKMTYQGLIFINAPQDRDIFDSVVHDFLIRISRLSEKERKKNLSRQLGE